jgi:hypothetical protein
MELEKITLISGVGYSSTENVAGSCFVTHGGPSKLQNTKPFCNLFREGLLLSDNDNILNPYVANKWGNFSEIY